MPVSRLRADEPRVGIDEVRFAARRVRSGSRDQLRERQRRRRAGRGVGRDGRRQRAEIGAELRAGHLGCWRSDRQGERAERKRSGG